MPAQATTEVLSSWDFETILERLLSAIENTIVPITVSHIPVVDK